MADEVGDGAGEDEEGEAGDHAHRHRPPHDEAAGVEIVEVPVMYIDVASFKTMSQIS